MSRSLLSPVLLLAAACSTSTGTDTAAAVGVAPENVTVSVDARIPTVIHVAWTTPEPTTGRVAFGDVALDHVRTDETASTDHAVSLFGLPSDTDVQLQVTTVTDAGAEATGDVLTAHTDPFGPDLPALSQTGTIQSWTKSFVAFNTVENPWAMILDGQGRVVWADPIPLEEDQLPMCVLLSRDGTALYEVIAGHQTDTAANSGVRKVYLDGSGDETIDWPYLDHDLVELDDGTLAGIVRVAHGDLWGDSIVERAPDGTFRTVYSSWDDEALPDPPMEVTEGELTHANALEYNAANNSYYINLTIPQLLVRVDRTSGAAVWHLYGKLHEFEHTSNDTEPITLSHGFEVLPDNHFLHFQNGEPGSDSLAREIAVDEDAHTYEQVWSFTHDPPLQVAVKGDVHRYADGGTAILWGTAGLMEDVSPEGESVWTAALDLGEVFTYFDHVDKLGP